MQEINFIEKHFHRIVTAVFLLLSVCGVLLHEPSLDEYQAFQIGKWSGSIPQLIDNYKYEGHLFVWFFLLFLQTKLSDTIVAMQLMHVCIATVTCFLIVNYSPFSKIQKILLVFGYYFFYEYNIISRCYAVEMLGLFFFMYFYSTSPNKLLPQLLSLLVVCHSGMFGVVLCGCILLYLLLEHTLNKDYKNSMYIVVWGLLNLLLVYLQIRHTPGNLVTSLTWANDMWYVIKDQSTELGKAYFPISNFWDIGFWNNNILTQNHISHSALMQVCTAWGIFLIFSYLFWKYKPLFIFYTLSTLIIFSVSYAMPEAFYRHIGHNFVVLIISLWLYLNRFGKLPLMHSGIVWLVVSINFFCGMYAYSIDCLYRYDNYPFVGQYLQQIDSDKYEYVVVEDHLIMPVVMYLNKPVYQLDHRAYETKFIKWNYNNLEPDWPEKIRLMDSLQSANGKTIILLTDYIVDESLKSRYGLVTLKKFDEPSIVNKYTEVLEYTKK